MSVPAVFLKATLMASPQIRQLILLWLCCGSPGTECFHSNKSCHLTIVCINATVISLFTLISALNVWSLGHTGFSFIDLCTFILWHTAAVGSLCVQATGRRSFQSVSPSSWSVRTKQEPSKKRKWDMRMHLPLGGNKRKREKPPQISTVNNNTDCLQQQSDQDT